MSKECRRHKKTLSLDVPFSNIDLVKRDAANVVNEETATPERIIQQKMSNTPKSKRLILVHSSPSSPPRMAKLTPVTLSAPVKMREHFQRFSGKKENKENRKAKDKFVESNNTAQEKRESRENRCIIKDKLKYSVDQDQKVRIALTHLRI